MEKNIVVIKGDGVGPEIVDKAIDVLNKCMEKGLSRMRNFQRQLVTEGMSLVAYPFSKILDVDHVEDIMKAEKFLNQK